jgi:leader peptidase (prepilin peptidase)/N-methyltransferase
VLATPSVAGGIGVVLMGLGFLGQWEGYAVLAWLGCGILTLTRTGERMALRLGYGCRRVREVDRCLIDPVWRQVLARCGVADDGVDLYVQAGAVVNAYAVGRRGVVVTSEVLASVRSGLLDARRSAAVLAHELGHQVTRAAQFGPMVAWLVLPWRLFSQAVFRLSVGASRSRRSAPVAVVVAAAFVAAIVQEVRAGAWAGAATLVALAVGGTVVPIADAAVGRASERAADRYAAQAGYAEALADALAMIDLEAARSSGLLQRILARHPDSATRVAAFAALAGVHTPSPAWWLFATGGAVLAVVDVRTHLLPSRLVYPLAAAELATLMSYAVVDGDLSQLGRAVLASAVVGAGWFGIAFCSPESLGLGDVRMAALAAGLLGWRGWHQVFAGQLVIWLLALVVAGGSAVAHRSTDVRGMKVPLGLPLVLAPLLVGL